MRRPSMMLVEEAMTLLKRGRLEPAYLLYGSNSFWKRQWLHLAQEKFLGSAAESNVIVRDDVKNFSEVHLELSEGGLFAQKKMVVVEPGRWPKKEEALERYLASPAPDSLLVIMEDKPSSALIKVMGPARVVEAKDLTPLTFSRFVADEANKLELTLDAKALELFCQMVRPYEYQAIFELQKLQLQSLGKISLADVKARVTPITGEVPLWDVTDAFLRRELAETLGKISRHLDRGVAPLVLFIMLVRQLSQIERAKRAKARKSSLAQFQSEENMKDFVAKKLWSFSDKWSQEAIDRLSQWAPKVDIAMKTGYGESALWLSFWVSLGLKKNPPAMLDGGRKDRR